MSFFDFFRNFFGVKRNKLGTSGLDDYDSHKDSFRNPIWQNDEDDDDIDDFRFFPRSGMHFNIFSNALEMTRYFEFHMDNILKNFFYGFNNGSFEDDAIKALPFAIPEKDSDLRNKVLKSELNGFTDIPSKQKVDTDLDGKITAEEFSKMWNKGNMETMKPSIPRSFSTGRSVRKEIICRPDGIVEQKQIIKDSEGNEETIVSREIGDKKHVITIIKDKNGVETKSEDFFNIDKCEIKDFTRKWTFPIKDDVDGHDLILNRFSWENFFGPNPKL